MTDVRKLLAKLAAAFQQPANPAWRAEAEAAKDEAARPNPEFRTLPPLNRQKPMAPQKVTPVSPPVPATPPPATPTPSPAQKLACLLQKTAYGRKAMKAMKEKYGPEKGKDVYYATANKEGRDPETFKKRGK